jgi:uncharacterized surface protein with fasciclin (FAS1) repeats
MNKEKSSKSCGSAFLAPAPAAATSRMVVMKAMVLDVKKSNDDVVTLKVKSEKRYLVVDDNNKVYSIASDDIDKLVKTIDFGFDFGRSYFWFSINGETKVSYVKHAKPSTHQGKKCLELGLYKKDIKAIGATAKEATNLVFHQGDDVTITMVSQMNWWDIPLPEEPSLYDVVEKAAGLSTLETALKATDLDEAVKDEGKTYTVFAPNDEAFQPLDLKKLLRKQNRNELGILLKRHVVQGQYRASDLIRTAKRKGHLTDLNGDEIPVKVVRGELRIGGARVLTADIKASNGVAHILDGVIVQDNC